MVDEARESGREMLKQFLVSQSTVARIRVNGQRNILLIYNLYFGTISDSVSSIRRALNGKITYLIATVGRIRVNGQKDIANFHF